jgi:hypothetical protein
MLSATGGGLDRAPQRLAVAHQLIEIRCAARDLGNGSVADCRTEGEVDGFYWTDSAPDIVNPGREEQGSVSV